MDLFRSKNQQIMILRNPSLRRDFLFIICSLCIFSFSTPIFSQGILGIVRENISKQPVANADVSIMKGDSVIASMTSDQDGHYIFNTTRAVRIHIAFQALGYKPKISDDILLDGYSTFPIEILLEVNVFDLPSVTVLSSRNIDPYIHHISSEDIAVTAANFDDPVRVAQSKPGIILLNDQSNHLSCRGQSPLFNNWYLEGLEIVNPNHTNNAGTFSDLPTQYGGGVNMFSAQTLGSTDLYTGINPLSIGNTCGAAFDMHLRESALPEWRAKAGLLGFEFGGGAALGTRGNLRTLVLILVERK